MRRHLRHRLSAHEQYASSVLFLFMLMVPWITLVWPPVSRHLQIWWVDALVRAAVIAVTAFVTGTILSRTAKFAGAITADIYAETFLRVGLAWSLFGIIVLVTGRTPSRIVHRTIPRMTALTYFGIGALLVLIAALAGTRARREHP